MKFYKVYWIIISLIIVFPLHSDQYGYEGHCISEPFNNLKKCLDKELAESDKKLNKVYNYSFKDFPHKNLIKVQLMWIKYRDADCDFIAEQVDEVSKSSYVYTACLIKKNKIRIAELKRTLFYGKWFERDTT